MSDVDFKGAIDAGLEALKESPEWLRPFEPAFAAISEYTEGAVIAHFDCGGVICLTGPGGKFPVFQTIRGVNGSWVIMESNRVAYGNNDVVTRDEVSRRMMRLMMGRHFAAILQKARAI